MKSSMIANKIIGVTLASILLFSAAGTVYATETNEKSDTASTYYPSTTTYNAGKGYAKTEQADDKKDVHYGWVLGDFVVTGFSKQTEGKNGDPVFVKTKGDLITLSYNLKQDINKIDGNDKITIANDKKGIGQEGIDGTEN